MDTLKKLKACMIEELNLEGVSPEDIIDDEPLFGEGLGLDSLEAIELVVLVKRHFGLDMQNMEEARLAFASPRTLAEYIDTHKN